MRPIRTARLETFHRSELTFDVADGGPLDGEPVVLLHGWPGGRETWRDLAPELHDRGFRTLAPDQRGYSPGARPRGVPPYVLGELVDDVLALAEAAGLDRFHVAGHDWGGAVAWSLAAAHADRLASVTVFSTPHPAALARSLWSSAQGLRSTYVLGFQLPILPERLLTARDGAVLRTLLERSGLDAELATSYTRRQLEPGALSASLAWYRALRRGGVRPPGPVDVPTLYVWSTGDAALGRVAAERTRDHVRGPYRFEVLEGVSHWIPEEVPGLAAAHLGAHLRAHALP